MNLDSPLVPMSSTNRARRRRRMRRVLRRVAVLATMGLVIGFSLYRLSP